jgi:hypothetical protein
VRGWGFGDCITRIIQKGGACVGDTPPEGRAGGRRPFGAPAKPATRQSREGSETEISGQVRDFQTKKNGSEHCRFSRSFTPHDTDHGLTGSYAALHQHHPCAQVRANAFKWARSDCPDAAVTSLNHRARKIFDTNLFFCSADQPQAANSGHPGAPMGMAPMAHLLWTEFLKFNPSNPRWVLPPRSAFAAET